jgi:hypothetical protein
MLSPEERHLILAILGLLLLGGGVKLWRNQVKVEHPPAIVLPSVTDELKADAESD